MLPSSIARRFTHCWREDRHKWATKEKRAHSIGNQSGGLHSPKRGGTLTSVVWLMNHKADGREKPCTVCTPRMGLPLMTSWPATDANAPLPLPTSRLFAVRRALKPGRKMLSRKDNMTFTFRLIRMRQVPVPIVPNAGPRRSRSKSPKGVQHSMPSGASGAKDPSTANNQPKLTLRDCSTQRRGPRRRGRITPNFKGKEGRRAHA